MFFHQEHGIEMQTWIGTQIRYRCCSDQQKWNQNENGTKTEYEEEWRGTKMEDREDANVSVSRKPFEFTQFISKFKIQTYLENANIGKMVPQLMCEMGHVIGTVFGASIMVLQLMHVH